MSLKIIQNINFYTECVTSTFSSTRGSSFSWYTQTKKKKTKHPKFLSTDQRLLLKRSLQYRIQHIGGWDTRQANQEQNPCDQNLKQMIQVPNYGTHHSKTIIYVT